jgi:hypothetical protein
LNGEVARCEWYGFGRNIYSTMVTSTASFFCIVKALAKISHTALFAQNRLQPLKLIPTIELHTRLCLARTVCYQEKKNHTILRHHTRLCSNKTVCDVNIYPLNSGPLPSALSVISSHYFRSYALGPRRRIPASGIVSRRHGHGARRICRRRRHHRVDRGTVPDLIRDTL